MANFKRQFGSVKRTDTPSGQSATPNVQREIKRTGRQPGDGVGDTATVTNPAVPAPKGSSPSLWQEAERAATNMGGFSGIDKEGRQKLIQEQYDKMVESDKQTKRWAYGSEKVVEGGILGDIK